MEQAVSLFTAIKHLKGHDCSNFINHLDDKGIELLCRIIHYILNGELQLGPRARGKLRNKIRGNLQEFKSLTTYPKHSRDIKKKRKVLQRGGIVGVLSAIAGAVIPLITQLLIK